MVGAVVALVTLLTAGPVHGQTVGMAEPPSVVVPQPLLSRDSGVVPWYTPVVSGLMPGTGQLAAGQDRGALYLIVEALLFTRFLSAHREGRRERNQFRELAFTVARGGFAPTVRDTSFEYFEQMSRFLESGLFDTDPGPSLVPPLDERTFNGSIWALARRTFFTNPDSVPDPSSAEYQRAVTFYKRRAVGDNFLWSWRNAGLEHDLFRQSIRQSDEAFRRATQQLGFMLANHLLSVIDGFIAHRLSRGGSRVELQSAVWPVPQGWDAASGSVVVTVRF